MPQSAKREQQSALQPIRDTAAFLCRAAFAGTLVAITVLALMPNDAETPSVMSSHVINHLAAFGVITLLLRLGWPKAAWVVAAVVATGFGLLLELLQWFLTNDRNPSLSDVAINLVGVGAGLAASLFALRVLRRYVPS